MRIKAFLKRFQLEYLMRVLRETGTRFPLSVLCCAFAVFLGVEEAHNFDLFSDDVNARLSLFLANGLALFTALRLFAESHRLDRVKTWALQVFGIVLVLAVSVLPSHFSAGHLFFGAALSLSMLFAPYAGRRTTDDSIWYFNYANGIALAIAGISTGVFCAGLSAILGSFDYLFGMDVPGRLYGDIWIFGGFFFGPVAFMFQIPRQFDYDRAEIDIPKGIFFIANYLVVPLLLIYTFILYVYFAKIVAQWELPKGNLAYMVTGFGALGIAARLAVFPMRENGTVLLQQFYKYFFLLLVIPVILLAIGLYTRISQYGVTEERYAIGVCLVWLAGLAAWCILRPGKAQLKQVPMVLAALMLLASYGPWSAEPVATSSQVARLEKMLADAGIDINGRIAKTDKQVSFDDRRSISSILEYLYEERKEDAIDRYVAPFRAELAEKEKGMDVDGCNKRGFSRCYYSYGRPERLMKAWGLDYVGRWESAEYSDYVSVRANNLDWNNDTLTRVSGYDYIMRFYSYTHVNGNNDLWFADRVYRDKGRDVLAVHFTLDSKGMLTITRRLGTGKDVHDGPQLQFALMPVLESLQTGKDTLVDEKDEDKLILNAETAGLKVQLRPIELRASRKNGVLVFDNAQLTVLIAVADDMQDTP